VSLERWADRITMADFIRQWWWWVGLGIALIATVFIARRSRGTRQQPADARSFAAVRVFTRDELRPYFGTYAPRLADLVTYLFLVILLVAISAVALFDLVPRTTWWGSVVAAALVGCFAGVLDLQSKRIMGPDRIAFDSPVPPMSWSVPLSKVSQCDLVPGRPHPRLRVHSDIGSFSLPLTNELWSVLSADNPTPRSS
jgi:hypothetical protein